MFLLFDIFRAERCDLLIVLLDEKHLDFYEEHKQLLDSKDVIFVQSMADLPRADISIDRKVLKVSSVTGEGIPGLISAIEMKLLPM